MAAFRSAAAEAEEGLGDQMGIFLVQAILDPVYRQALQNAGLIKGPHQHTGFNPGGSGIRRRVRKRAKSYWKSYSRKKRKRLL
jgi:hypothetical protein